MHSIQFLTLLIALQIFTQRYVSALTCANSNHLILMGKIKMNLAANITEMHNSYRLKVAQGRVISQPRAINMHRLYYDPQLEESAKQAGLDCTLDDSDISDPRWYWVGQNKYLVYTNVPSSKQHWDSAIGSWFDEHQNYSYPDQNTSSIIVSRASAHYTQLVWAESRLVGCSFVLFHEPRRPGTPYGHLYTCVYGPGGNVIGKPPYRTGSRPECTNLCET